MDSIDPSIEPAWRNKAHLINFYAFYAFDLLNLFVLFPQAHWRGEKFNLINAIFFVRFLKNTVIFAIMREKCANIYDAFIFSFCYCDREIIPDYKVMLDAVKLVYKMRSGKPDTQINIANIFGWKWSDL